MIPLLFIMQSISSHHNIIITHAYIIITREILLHIITLFVSRTCITPVPSLSGRVLSPEGVESQRRDGTNDNTRHITQS